MLFKLNEQIRDILPLITKDPDVLFYARDILLAHDNDYQSISDLLNDVYKYCFSLDRSYWTSMGIYQPNQDTIDAVMAVFDAIAEDVIFSYCIKRFQSQSSTARYLDFVQPQIDKALDPIGYSDSAACISHLLETMEKTKNFGLSKDYSYWLVETEFLAHYDVFGATTTVHEF